MPDLHSLDAEVRGLVDPPAFETLVSRSRRRARRRVGAAGLAVVVVVGGAALTTGGRTTSRTGPVTLPSPSPSPSAPPAGPADDPRADAIVDDSHARIGLVSGDRDGDVMAVFSVGSRTAIATYTGLGVTGAHLSPPMIDDAYPIPDGWILAHQAGDVVALKILRTTGGAVQPVPTSTVPVTPAFGDVPLFPGDSDLIEVYTPSDGLVHPIISSPRDLRYPYAGYVTKQGRLLVVGSDRHGSSGVVETYADGAWTHSAAESGLGGSEADLAGSQDHVVVVGATSMRISDDGGGTWRTTAAPRDSGISAVSMVTSSGTVFVDAAGGSARVPLGGRLEPLPSGRVPVFVIGDDVYARAGERTLLVSHDQGLTWHPAAIPGTYTHG